METRPNISCLVVAAARAAGGVLAVIAAAVMSSRVYPAGEIAQADGWGILAGIALCMNGAAMASHMMSVKGGSGRAKPALGLLDAAVPFIAVCAMTVAFTTKVAGGFDYLFGVWLMGCGAINLSLRRHLPAGARYAGYFYLAAGILLMFVFRFPFMNPWPMATTLFVGEWICACSALAESRLAAA